MSCYIVCIEYNIYSAGVAALCWCQHTDTSTLATVFVESKLDIVMIKTDLVSLTRMVPFLILAGHIIMFMYKYRVDYSYSTILHAYNKT